MPPSRLPALGLGAGRTSQGHSEGTGTEGEPVALCLSRANTGRRLLQTQEHLFAAEQNRQSWAPTVMAPGHEASWRGIGKKKGTVHHPSTAAQGKEQRSPAPAPFPAPQREKPGTLTQLCPATPQPHARLMGHCAPAPGAAQTSQTPSKVLPVPRATPDSLHLGHHGAAQHPQLSASNAQWVLPRTCSPVSPAAALVHTPLTWAF